MRFAGQAQQMLDELHPEVRDAICRELRRFHARIVQFEDGPSCPLAHLHAEGYCLGYRFDHGGALEVVSMSVRCSPAA